MIAVAPEHVAERRNADTLTRKRAGVVLCETEAGISAGQLVPGADGKRASKIGGAIERRIVMHDDNAIARKTHVEFDSVGLERKTVVERGDRVFGRERAAPAMRERERAVRFIELVAHAPPVYI